MNRNSKASPNSVNNQIKHENRIKEYEMLRAEILQKIELHNTLITFTITATNAILALALFQYPFSSPYAFLLPLGIIIPMSLRISYYRTGMMKLAAYIEAIIEPEEPGLEWEIRNTSILLETSPFMNTLSENPNTKGPIASSVKKSIGKHVKNSLNGTYARNYECFILSIICYVLYISRMIATKSPLHLDATTAINILLPLLAVIWEYYICRYCNRIIKERIQWKDSWKESKSNTIPTR